MIITVVCDVLGEENNGTTIACMNLIRALKKRGHEVRVVCMDIDKKGQDGWYVVPELNLGFINYFVHKNGVSLASPDRKILEAAIRDCDLVHTTFTFDLSRVAIDIAKKYNKPVTSSFHCQAENYTTHLLLQNCEPVNRHVYRRYFRQIYGRADCIHYPTQFIRDIFEKINGDTNGFVISNGVNQMFVPGNGERPGRLSDKFIILSVGRLSGEKNHAVLIDGIAHSKYRDSIHLIIAGEGPLRDKLISRALRRNVDMEIDFYTRDDLKTIMDYSDLYVHPAEVEIEAIACLEAICCGMVPVIADSPKSATRRFAIDERSLFSNNDAYDLAKKIDFWIEHPELIKKYRSEYLLSAPDYSQEKCMDQMEQMMINTVARCQHEENIQVQ